jgi:predicted component of type VI protein secretion system
MTAYLFLVYLHPHHRLPNRILNNSTSTPLMRLDWLIHSFVLAFLAVLAPTATPAHLHFPLRLNHDRTFTVSTKLQTTLDVHIPHSHPLSLPPTYPHPHPHLDPTSSSSSTQTANRPSPPPSPKALQVRRRKVLTHACRGIGGEF